MSRPLALITGASSGIGAQIALELARTGYDLVLTARTTSALQEIAAQAASLGAQSTILACDLSVPSAAEKLVEEVNSRQLVLDVLVNNAGFGDSAPFLESDPKRIDQMILLNIVALTDLTRALAPAMVARKSGRIMLVSSIAAYQPGPGMAVYCATKAYVLSLGEALASELSGSGVTVTTLCPGATRTAFASAANAGDIALFRTNLVMDAAAVARSGVKALQAGRCVVVTGLLNKLLAWSGRVLPRFLTVPIARAMMAKPHKA